MKQHTATEKFNGMRPSVFFSDWSIFGWPMRLTLALLYALFLTIGLMALFGAGLVIYLLFQGEWKFLLAVAAICLFLTPARTK